MSNIYGVSPLQGLQGEVQSKAAYEAKMQGVAGSALNQSIRLDRPSTEIEQATSLLEEAIQMLEVTQRTMRDRLTPILALDRPEVQMNRDKEAPAQYGASNMGKMLIEATSRINRMRSEMQSTIDLLAL